MESIGSILTVIALIFGLTNTVVASDDLVANYIISVINNLSLRENGASNCIVFGLSSNYPFEGTLEEVVNSPELDHVTKYVVTIRVSKSDVELLPTNPSLLLIQGREISQIFDLLTYLLNPFKSSTKVIVLVYTQDDYEASAAALEHLKYYKLVFILVPNHQVMVEDSTNGRRIVNFPNPDDLFRDNFKPNLEGRSITYTSWHVLQAEDYLRKWVKEVASFMNTTAREVEPKCSTQSRTIHDDCYVEHFYFNKIDFDCTIYNIGDIDSTLFMMLTTCLSETQVILVPRTQLNIFQLFAIPFDWQVWTILIMIFIVLEVAQFKFPSLFKNDPILLIIFGFEQLDLHKTKFWEQIIFQPLVVLMFFVKCAYETIFLSLLISKPPSRLIRTIDELIESGIKIKANFLLSSQPMNNTVFGEMLVNSTDSMFELDMVHAYIVQKRIADSILPLYYDPIQRLNRYNIMDQMYGMFLKSFMMATRSPLMEVFNHILKALIESGIFSYWRTLKHQEDFKIIHVHEKSLSFTDIAPAWIVVSSGLLLSVSVFMCEIAWVKFYKRIAHLENRIASEKNILSK